MQCRDAMAEIPSERKLLPINTAPNDPCCVIYIAHVCKYLAYYPSLFRHPSALTLTNTYILNILSHGMYILWGESMGVNRPVPDLGGTFRLSVWRQYIELYRYQATMSIDNLIVDVDPFPHSGRQYRLWFRNEVNLVQSIELTANIPRV